VRVCIHRGAREIGGSCVEVEHDGARLFLDAGLPLDVERVDDERLPLVAGLADGDPSIVGLVVSHGHPDHYGLVAKVHPAVPVYIGEATERILRQAAFFTRVGADLHAAGHLADRTPLTLAPFTVTPYLVDHSAFDAYALLVEAGGKRLLYSGDLRAHGRKAGLFERLVREPPAGVDVLLLEGTNIRDGGTPAALSERAVEERCAALFRSTRGMVLAAYPAQNVDRLVTLYRAARRGGRALVLDLYAATMARATDRDTIPQADWDGVRVFVPISQRIKVKQAREFERIDWVRRRRLFAEDLAGRAGELVMIFRGSMATELDRAGCLDGAHAVWSMWHGYLNEPSGVALRDWLAARHIPLALLHSSGHARVADLQRLATAINAREVVPVHTRHPDRYGELFTNVREHPDGQWWTA
jgi:ribonuclease J